MREFANQKALQDYVESNDLVYLWEGVERSLCGQSAIAKATRGQCEDEARGDTRTAVLQGDLACRVT